MGDHLIKIAIPSKYCPKHPDALEVVKYLTSCSLYRMVLNQSCEEFYTVSTSDLKLLLEPSEVTIGAFVSDESLDKLKIVKKQYPSLSYKQVMKVLVLKKLFMLTS